ncbi:MAG: DEAD/DEAH box helicase family protein [Oribacterium sp.]|nr:DEAD/DEAH box helicase family protein [Oribacterium sp.]
MSEYFENNYNKITYPIDSAKKKGLRNAQLGAIHAISAFYSVHCSVAAIVVMPTGAGKTEVLMISPYLLRKKRVLVVTPSKMVRGQIVDDFSGLRTLLKANVFKDNMRKPCVYEMEHKYSDKYLEALEKADVIVATPFCALSLSETEWAKNNIDLVEVDEAHHSRATTWQQILVNLLQATHILFTATPFRLDRKELSGEIIFDYPLSKAYKDGIFGEIQYVPVESGDNNDVRIAKKAEEILLNDRNAGYEHCLMVRTDTKENASALVDVYTDNTSLKLSKIDSSMSNARIRETLNNLKAGNIDGIICVNMLGEGYDFPNLKIAAIHSPHKSLASTLQFVGRFARTNANKIGMAKFIAVNNEELAIENNYLFSKDAVWQDMIIGMSEVKNKEEQENRNYYKEYEVTDVNILSDVPIQAIRPNCHVKIFRVKGFNISSDFPDACNVANRVLRNDREKTVVGIGLSFNTPLWLGNGEKINMEYILYILHYQEETSMLYIYSQLHSEAMYEEIATSFCTDFDQIPKYEIYKVLGDLKDFEIFNSGMQSKQAQSGESYRIMAGSDVSDAIDKESGRMYSAGHAFCKATDKNEGELTIGYSSASKVWSSSYKDLKDYIVWCDSLGKKISNKELKVKTNTNFDYLPQPLPLKEYPLDIFWTDYGYTTYCSNPVLWINDKAKPIRLTDAELIIQKTELTKVIFMVKVDENVEILECDIKGHYSSNDEKFTVYSGRDSYTLSQYFNEVPLIFKTLSDKTIIGVDIIEGDFEEDVFDSSIIEGIDWGNTDLSLEFRKNKTDKRVAIQDKLQEILIEDDSNKYVIFDHGTGEIADFIAIQEKEYEVYIELFHVKKKSSAGYNSSVGDIYEVVGQAMKSVSWFSSKSHLLSKMIDRHATGHCIVKKGGDFERMIKELKDAGKAMHGSICIVQPGISNSVEVPLKIQEVLAATNSYIRKAGKVNRFRVIGSL